MGGPQKVTCLFISPSNKFRDHSHQNPIKKLVPMKEMSTQVSEIHLKKSSKHFSKPEFLVKLWFPKTRVSSPVAPGGFLFPEKYP